MSSGTSYNGWPANDDKAAIGVVSNDLFPGGVKAGDVAIVLSYVMRQLNARVEPVTDGHCWGYTYKANVNNPSQLSCHASGTAGDFNAPSHPNGSSGTFTEAQRGVIYQILDEVQGSVSWLEGYDEMHFEICVNASDLAYVAAILGDAAPPTPGPEPEPEPPPVPPLTGVGMYVVFGPNGARLCGPGYWKNLDEEEYAAICTVPGIQLIEVDQRGFDVHGAIAINGTTADQPA
jgi:hypothetical protein